MLQELIKNLQSSLKSQSGTGPAESVGRHSLDHGGWRFDFETLLFSIKIFKYFRLSEV